jgi:hypothetical protein
LKENAETRIGTKAALSIPWDGQVVYVIGCIALHSNLNPSIIFIAIILPLKVVTGATDLGIATFSNCAIFTEP